MTNSIEAEKDDSTLQNENVYQPKYVEIETLDEIEANQAHSDERDVKVLQSKSISTIRQERRIADTLRMKLKNSYVSQNSFTSRIQQKINSKLDLEVDRYELDENVILPVYRISEDIIAIGYENNRMSDSLYSAHYSSELWNAYWKPLNIPGQVNTIVLQGGRIRNIIKHKVIDSLRILPNRDLIFNVYGTEGIAKSRIREFVFYVDECNMYEFYVLKNYNDSIGSPLFASIKPLNLIISENEETINKSNQIGLYQGLSGKDNKERLFKQIAGTELYLMFDDSFPINCKVDYPSRSLFWKTEQSVMVPIWLSSLDLNGDGCL